MQVLNTTYNGVGTGEGLCCQAEGRNTVWGHIFVFAPGFPQEDICHPTAKAWAYVLLASVSKLCGDGLMFLFIQAAALNTVNENSAKPKIYHESVLILWRSKF